MMRKLKSILGVLLLMLTITTITSCNYERQEIVAQEVFDESYAAATNPEFTTVEEVLSYQASVLGDSYINSTFESLSPAVVENVTNVLLKRKDSITKKDIVLEYDTHKEVYEGLSSPPNNNTSNNGNADPISTNNENNTTARQVSSGTPTVSIRHVTDTVNGVPVRVTIREERTYE